MPSTPPIDSPRIQTPIDAREELGAGHRSPPPHASTQGSPSSTHTTPSSSHSHGHPHTFRTHPSTSSLASVASAAKSPTGPRNPASGRLASGSTTGTSKLASDTASIGGVSVAGMMTTQSASKGKARSRSQSTATIKERSTDKEKKTGEGEDSKDNKEGKDGKEGKEGKERSKEGKEGKDTKAVATRAARPNVRYRQTPYFPSSNDVEIAPATLMYWSRAPVYGYLPTHGLRAHTATLVDNVAWIFGGCDEKACSKDVWCFFTETMQWTHPTTCGDVPSPCRAHTATLVDTKLVMIGGGEGGRYYNGVYVLDTLTHRWSRPTFPADMQIPAPRRAHTSVYYRGKIWVFGGGNGKLALNDLWTLEVGTTANVDRMKWELMATRGRKPTARGYHTANLIGNVMVVVGGSDGRECFSDIWCLNLGVCVFTMRGVRI